MDTAPKGHCRDRLQATPLTNRGVAPLNLDKGGELMALINYDLLNLIRAAQPFASSKGKKATEMLENMVALLEAEPGTRALSSFRSLWNREEAEPMDKVEGQGLFDGAPFILFLILILLVLAHYGTLEAGPAGNEPQSTAEIQPAGPDQRPVVVAS